MPFRRTTKKSYTKKRTYRKRGTRRGRANKNLTVQVARSPISRSTIVRLKYVDANTMSPSSTTSDWVVLRANSVYDPYYLTGGHQPMGFDQYMTFYQKYMVLGAKITCQFVSDSISSTDIDDSFTLTCILKLSSSPTTVSSMTENMENPDVVYKICNSAQSGSKTVLVKRMSSKKWFGLSKVKDNESLAGTSGSNPLYESYFHIGIGPFSAVSATPRPVRVLYTIEYITLFTQPIQLGQS